MADSIKKGRSRANFTQQYNELFDIYLKHIGKGNGLAYYSYLKRYVNNEAENDYKGYAYPGTRKISDELGIGNHKIKEVQLKCIAWGLLEVSKQEYSNNLYLVNDPLTKQEFYNSIETGELPLDINIVCPDLLPPEKELSKILDDIHESALLLKSEGVLLRSNRVKSGGVAEEQQGALPNNNGGVTGEQRKNINLNNSFEEEEDGLGEIRSHIIEQAQKKNLTEEETQELISQFVSSYLNKLESDGEVFNPLAIFQTCLNNYMLKKNIHKLGHLTTYGKMFGKEAGEESIKNLTEQAKKRHDEKE